MRKVTLSTFKANGNISLSSSSEDSKSEKAKNEKKDSRL